LFLVYVRIFGLEIFSDFIERDLKEDFYNFFVEINAGQHSANKNKHSLLAVTVVHGYVWNTFLFNITAISNNYMLLIDVISKLSFT